VPKTGPGGRWWKCGRRGSGHRYRPPAAIGAGERAAENAQNGSKLYRWAQSWRGAICGNDRPPSAGGFASLELATTGEWKSRAATVHSGEIAPSGGAPWAGPEVGGRGWESGRGQRRRPIPDGV